MLHHTIMALSMAKTASELPICVVESTRSERLIGPMEERLYAWYVQRLSVWCPQEATICHEKPLCASGLGPRKSGAWSPHEKKSIGAAILSVVCLAAAVLLAVCPWQRLSRHRLLGCTFSRHRLTGSLVLPLRPKAAFQRGALYTSRLRRGSVTLSKIPDPSVTHHVR